MCVDGMEVSIAVSMGTVGIETELVAFELVEVPLTFSVTTDVV